MRMETQTRPVYVTATSEKSRTVALLLCVFLGFLGIHRFYVGKIGTGVIYLFTIGIFGLGWLYDILQILMGGFKDNADAPLRNW